MSRNWPGICHAYVDATPGFSKIILSASLGGHIASCSGVFACKLTTTGSGGGSGSTTLEQVSLASIGGITGAVPHNKYIAFQHPCCDSGIDFSFGTIDDFGSFSESVTTSGTGTGCSTASPPYPHVCNSNASPWIRPHIAPGAFYATFDPSTQSLKYVLVTGAVGNTGANGASECLTTGLAGCGLAQWQINHDSADLLLSDLLAGITVSLTTPGSSTSECPPPVGVNLPPDCGAPGQPDGAKYSGTSSFTFQVAP